jgi:hypothetical protein
VFHNELSQETGLELSKSEKHYGHTLTSSVFIHNGTRCILVDDTLGTVYVAAQRNSTVEVIRAVGTIDYMTGTITLINFSVDSYDGNYIEVKVLVEGAAVYGFNNVILLIDPIDVAVTLQGVKK